MKNIIDDYSKMFNYGVLECPFCHSNKIIRWGKYERNIIYWNEENVLESKVVAIQRVRCESCGKTHAILPFGVVPYKQFSLEIIIKALIEISNDKIANISDNYKINENIIIKWRYDYVKKHFFRLKTQLKENQIDKILKIIYLDDDVKKEYLKRYNRFFMQIKLGYIGLTLS